MEAQVCRLLLTSALLAATSLAALPARECSISLSLCTTDSGAASAPDHCTFVDADPATFCNSLSPYLERHKSLVAADDCLEMRLYPGTYTLTEYSSTLNYSAVITAVEDGVTITCVSECAGEPEDSTSPLWFQRNSAFSSHLSLNSSSATSGEDGEFFVQMEGVSFESCQRPLRFDAMDYVGISNCSFTGFTSSAVDIFNCQNALVEFSLFLNCTAMQEKEQYRSNSGGLSIAYHTNNTVYFNQSRQPWVHVTDCVFRQNRVLLPGANTQQQINQALNNHYYFGRGGGFGLFLDEYFINIIADIERCWFDENFAQSFGGGLYLYVDGSSTQHALTVRDCNFTRNQAGDGSFGGGLQVALLIRNSDRQPSRISVIRCNFTENKASFGGGLSTVQLYSQSSGNLISLRDSYFAGNEASDVGSAVMFASLLYVQTRNASHYYQVSDNIFFNNTSPGGTFGAGFIPQNFTGHNWFLNNTGPGLRSVGSQVAVIGNLSFIGNNAENYEGGAVYISAFGQLKLYRGTVIDFIDNVGRIGAAIVVDVQRSSQVFSQLIFNTQCFLLFENATIAPDEWDQVTVRFSGNRAAVAPVVYISHLSLCSWFSVSRVSNTTNQIQSSFSTFNFTQWQAFDFSSNDNIASSHPNGDSPTFYFQTEATSLMSQTIHTNQSMAVYPGQDLRLNLIGLDQFTHPTYLIARVSDSRADINSGAFSQSTDAQIEETTNAKKAVNFEPALIPIQPSDHSVHVLYRVPSSAQDTLREGGNITVVVDTPYNVIDSAPFKFQINSAFCLPGYELRSRVEGEDLLSCTCLDTNFNILTCDDSNNVIVLRDGLWASRENDPHPHLRVHTCPAPFCQCSNQNDVLCDSIYYHDDPNANKQCHALREGTLCGRCVNGTGVGVLRFNCRDCDSSNYWALGFLVIGDILVCVLILVALVKLRFTCPHSMKGLLFYIQTVYYATAYFPASFWDARKYMLYLGSVLGLYFPWDFCLFPGMPALSSFPSRFIPPLIATAVTTAAVISVFHCFEKRAQKRIWHGVWAFVLLLYTPLAHTCFILLHCPSLPPAHGGDPRPRWFLDGEVVCFRDGGHIALGLIAILIIPVLSLLPLAIFLFTVYAHSPKIQADYPVVERLYTALAAGYQVRARWWGAWDLTRRLLLIGIVVAFPGRSVAALYIVIPALALHLFMCPYLRWWQNLLEALVLANYTLLLLLRSTQTVLDDLASYSGTAVPESRGTGLAPPDRLTLLFSVWYYWPLVMGCVAVVAIATRSIITHVRLRSHRGRSKSTFEMVEDYHDYDNTATVARNSNVTVTQVSIN